MKYNSALAPLNNKLQQVLDNEGIEQAKLSRASGINATTINMICLGKQPRPRNATKTRLVKAINELVKREAYTVPDIFTA